MTSDLICSMRSSHSFLAFQNVESLWTIRLYQTEFPRKPILPRLAEYEFTSEGNVKETQRFAVRNHTVVLYLTTHLPGSKCETKSKPNSLKCEEGKWKHLLLPLYTSLLYRLFTATDDCVNPPRHVSFGTIFVHVMSISVSIKMCPFWLVILRPYIPTTRTVEPFLNSMLPLNLITAARCSPCELEEDLFSCDAL